MVQCASKCVLRPKPDRTGVQIYVRVSKDVGDCLKVSKGGHSLTFLEMHAKVEARSRGCMDMHVVIGG